MQQELSKRCVKCKKTKFFMEFHKNKCNKDGYQKICITCRSTATGKIQKTGNQFCRNKACEIPLSADTGYPNKKSPGRFSRLCKKCDIKAAQDYARKNPERQKRSDLKKNYNMTLEEYNQMRHNQNYACAICFRTEEYLKTKNKKWRLQVDHCHNTGKTRELLCYSCNFGIGFFQDSITIMENAIDYVYKHDLKNGLFDQFPRILEILNEGNYND